MRAPILALMLLAGTAHAQTDVPSTPYDPDLLRLAEILGSLHFLRRLCNASEGPIWRDAMAELLEAERPSAERERALTNQFNRGFAAFNRTYTTCTPAAVRAAELYQGEGVRLSSRIVTRYAR